MEKQKHFVLPHSAISFSSVHPHLLPSPLPLHFHRRGRRRRSHFPYRNSLPSHPHHDIPTPPPPPPHPLPLIARVINRPEPFLPLRHIHRKDPIPRRVRVLLPRQFERPQTVPVHTAPELASAQEFNLRHVLGAVAGLALAGLTAAPGEADGATVCVWGRDGRLGAQLSFEDSEVEGAPDMLCSRGECELKRQGTVAVPAVGDLGCGDLVGT